MDRGRSGRLWARSQQHAGPPSCQQARTCCSASAHPPALAGVSDSDCIQQHAQLAVSGGACIKPSPWPTPAAAALTAAATFWLHAGTGTRSDPVIASVPCPCCRISAAYLCRERHVAAARVGGVAAAAQQWRAQGCGDRVSTRGAVITCLCLSRLRLLLLLLLLPRPMMPPLVCENSPVQEPAGVMEFLVCNYNNRGNDATPPWHPLPPPGGSAGHPCSSAEPLMR